MRVGGILTLGLALGLGTVLLLRVERGSASRSIEPEPQVARGGALDAQLETSAAVVEPASESELGREVAEPMPTTVPSAESGPAWLTVSVAARGDGRPLSGIDVQALLRVFLDEAMERPEYVHGSLGQGVESLWLTTDPSGRVVLELRSGVAYGLRINSRDAAHARLEWLAVEPLAAGERRTLEVALDSGDDLRWFGRVLDDATGAPLAGSSAVSSALSSVASTLGARESAVAAADGMLELAFASWRPTWVTIAAPGYLPAAFALERGHGSPQSARIVRLVRPGSLTVRVRDEQGGARADVRVEVDTARPEGELGPTGALGAGTTDADGACTFEELPPRVELSVAVRAGIGRTQRQAVRLVPGEESALTFELGPGCTLLGRALDEQGSPLVKLELWRLAAGELPALRELAHEDAVVDKVRTDSLGRFAFEHVPEGEWWVGPAPSRRVAGVEPLATRVTVHPGETRLELTLVCSAPLYIQGHVRSPGGKGAQATVSAWRAGTRVSAESREDGRFHVGPLADGEWLLRAEPPEWCRQWVNEAPSAVVRAAAGAEGVQLELRTGTLLAGVVHDENGRGVPGAKVALALDEHGLPPTETTDAGGWFWLRTQVPGSTHLWARSGAFVAWVGPVVAEQGRHIEPLKLRLQTGAELRLRLAPAAPAGLEARVVWNGVPIVVAALAPGAERSEVLPPGEIVVQLVRSTSDGGPALLEEHALLLLAGAPALLELGVDSRR